MSLAIYLPRLADRPLRAGEHDQLCGLPVLALVGTLRGELLDRGRRDYETLRIGMQALFHDLGITVSPAAA